MSNLAIVITAYNRAEPLRRLLRSLDSIVSVSSIPLVISIDNKGTAEVNQVAEEFKWIHGEKKVIIHQEKLGLRAHFIWAGDQSYEYENVLFLEDDLYVSPHVLEYVYAVIDKYVDDERVAGGALYNPLLCEFDKCKFYQYEDGYDNYFFAHPYWGNIWCKRKWNLFKKWLETYEYKPELLPKSVQLWNETSFKKLYIQYLAETNRYIVYPRVSYVTNMGEAGLHSKKQYRQFQTSYQRGSKTLQLSNFDQSSSVYDVFFELTTDIIKRHNPNLAKYDFVNDIRGLRSKGSSKYVLTRRNVKKEILSFSDEMRPLECNVIEQIEGQGIRLASTDDVLWEEDYEINKIREDILELNYCIGLREVLACFKVSLKDKVSSMLGRRR